MRLQLLSDLHLETEAFEPRPAPDADLLVLAGDIDSTWAGLERFAGWPVPVLYVAGNHEFDRRDIDEAASRLRRRCDQLGLHMLERESHRWQAPDGRTVRFLGTTRWCDFGLFGEAQRERSQRAARYFVDVMRATRHGRPFDAEAVRQEALACRAWLETALRDPADAAQADLTVVVTHYGPSLRSQDPRYGKQPGTASFCNADDDLFVHADLWLHGHLHCRHDYVIEHGPDVPRARTRVVSNARGHGGKGESQGHDGLMCITV